MRLTIYPVAAISTPTLILIIAIAVVAVALIAGLALLMRGKKKDPAQEEDEPLMRTKKGKTDDSEILSGDEQITVSLDTTGDFLSDGIMAETPEDGENFKAFEEGEDETLINVDMGDGWEDFGKGDSSFEENADASSEETQKASEPARTSLDASAASADEQASEKAQPFTDYQGTYDEAEDETSVLGAAPAFDSSFEHITAQAEPDSEEEGASLLGDDAFSSGRGVGHRRNAQKEDQQAIYYQDSLNSTGNEEKSTEQGIPRAFVFRVGTEERREINKNKFSIGKSQNADYTVSGNNKISRVHAIVIYEKGSFFLADNHSSNHTYLEDQELNPDRMYELTEGSRIRLANEEFVFHLL